jgi:hypothetical protein
MPDIPLGRAELIHVKPETNPGVFVMPSASDAIRIRKASLQFMQDRKNRDDKLTARGFNERITQMKKGTFSIGSYLIPSGAAGTPPDISDLLKACMGVETITPGVSVVYTPSTDLEQPQSLSIYQQLGHLSRVFMGCYIDKMKISLDKKNEADIEFSGIATDSGHSGTSAINGTVLAGQSQITVATGDGDKFSKEGHIKIGNDSTDYKITDITGDVLTLSPALVDNANDGEAVLPFSVSSITAGLPIGSILGSVNIAGSPVFITKATINYDNGLTPRDEEYGRDTISGVKLGNRSVTFEFELFLRKDYLRYYGKAKQFVSSAVTFVAGTQPGKICTIFIPKAEFEIPQIDGGGIEEIMLPVKGVALMTSDTGNDEITITFS